MFKKYLLFCLVVEIPEQQYASPENMSASGMVCFDGKLVYKMWKAHTDAVELLLRYVRTLECRCIPSIDVLLFFFSSALLHSF